MSILRPSSSQMTRRLIVLATVIFAIAISQIQMFMGWGQTAAEFAADSDTTLKVAGYAFAIWGVIYAGLLVYAIRQALPQTGESEMINRFGWPSILAFLGIGWWIVAAAFDWELATIGQTVGHEVHGPHEVRRVWNREHVRLVPLDAPPWLDPQVQFQFAVDPANALVVPGMATDIAQIQEA